MVPEELAALSAKAEIIINSNINMDAFSVMCNEYKQKAREIFVCKSVDELSLKDYESKSGERIPQERSSKMCFMPLEDYRIHLHSKKKPKVAINEVMDIPDCLKDGETVSDVNHVHIPVSMCLQINKDLADSANDRKDSGFCTDRDSVPQNRDSGNDNFEDFVEFKNVVEVTNVRSESTVTMSTNHDYEHASDYKFPDDNCFFEEHRNMDIYEEVEEDNTNFYSIKTVTVSTRVKSSRQYCKTSSQKNGKSDPHSNGNQCDSNSNEVISLLDNEGEICRSLEYNNDEFLPSSRNDNQPLIDDPSDIFLDCVVEEFHTASQNDNKEQQHVPLICSDDEDSIYPLIDSAVEEFHVASQNDNEEQQHVPLICSDDEDNIYPSIDNAVEEFHAASQNDNEEQQHVLFHDEEDNACPLIDSPVKSHVISAEGENYEHNSEDHIRIMTIYSLNSATQHLNAVGDSENSEPIFDTTSMVNYGTLTNNAINPKNCFLNNFSLCPCVSDNAHDEINLPRNSYETALPMLVEEINISRGTDDENTLTMLVDEMNTSNDADETALPLSAINYTTNNVYPQVFLPDCDNDIDSNVTLTACDSKMCDVTLIESEVNSESIPSKALGSGAFKKKNLHSSNAKTHQKSNIPVVFKSAYSTRSLSHCKNYKLRSPEKKRPFGSYSTKRQYNVKKKLKTSDLNKRHLSSGKMNGKCFIPGPVIKNGTNNSVSRQFGSSSSRLGHNNSVDEKRKAREEKVQRSKESREKLQRKREETIRLGEEKRIKKFKQHEKYLKEKNEAAKNKGRQRRGARNVSGVSPPNLEAPGEEISKLDRTYSVPRMPPKIKDLSPVENLNEKVANRSRNEEVMKSSDKKLFMRPSVVVEDMAKSFPHIFQFLAKPKDNGESSNETSNMKNKYKMRCEVVNKRHLTSPSISVHHRRPLRSAKNGSCAINEPIKKKMKFSNSNGVKRINTVRNSILNKGRIKPNTPLKFNLTERIPSEKYPTRQYAKTLYTNLPAKQFELKKKRNYQEKGLPVPLGSFEISSDADKMKLKPSWVVNKIGVTASLNGTSSDTPINEKVPRNRICRKKSFFGPKFVKPGAVANDIGDKKKRKLSKVRRSNAKRMITRYGLKQINAAKHNEKTSVDDAFPRDIIYIAADISSYDMTDINEDSSDDSDVTSPKIKLIPFWATGILLKTALFQQTYTPPDLDEIFGISEEHKEVNLVEMFSVDKPFYHHRTSSATWSDDNTQA